jgi:hypothetical protein
MRRLCLILLPLAGFAPVPVCAQSQLPSRFVSIGATAQISSNDFAQRFTFPLFAEHAKIEGPLAVSRGVRVDARMGLHLWSRLGVGLLVSRLRTSGHMHVTYTLPYPFLFDDPRVAVADSASRRGVTDLHVQAHVLVVGRDRWQVVASGGPSATWLSQELATDRLQYTYDYPFDSITVTPRSGVTKGHGFGGHAGLTLTRRLGRHFGLDADMRWSFTRVRLESAGSTLTLHTGGPQAGGAFRVVF